MAPHTAQENAPDEEHAGFECLHRLSVPKKAQKVEAVHQQSPTPGFIREIKLLINDIWSQFYQSWGLSQSLETGTRGEARGMAQSSETHTHHSSVLTPASSASDLHQEIENPFKLISGREQNLPEMVLNAIVCE